MQRFQPVSDARLGFSASPLSVGPDGSGRGLVVPRAAGSERIVTCGKFFRCGSEKWFIKGLTYGPFPKSAEGHFLPEQQQVRKDFRQISALGGNCVRVYHIPPRWLLDEAIEHNLRVFVDVPWEKHRCFFEDWSSQEEARLRVRSAARELGDHPGLFAISVANEFPADAVRFQGYRRVERFVDELIDTVKQAAPQCLATFANYPTTEFLNPIRRDFVCFNVYLEDQNSLAAYLDRLQHLSGSLPLMLGEFGADSFRHGEDGQAESLSRHVRTVFRHGLAGSFVFSYCDEWFTGGHLVESWAFGITRKDRTEKPALAALKREWASPLNTSVADTAPARPLPRVSVVVCSYNGGATLRECLTSLGQLNYPNYEVILVDDGSTDHTPEIIKDFSNVRSIRQVNRGLSVARNVGAQEATGDIVAYTDSDCVADPDWLFYLVTAMLRMDVRAIGGPNLPPPSDSWIAQCVAASPGGPSHVMLNDQLAEHVPGCNMAFDRNLLLSLGGFDPQFRQAGDDVDICWRFMDAGYQIGFASAAMVWHHRRNTARAYFKQQKGYGRSEAMLAFKHVQRFNRLGCSRWDGIIYGEGAVGLPVLEPLIYHGRHGSGLFQTIYSRQQYTLWAYTNLLEWHLAAAFVLAIATMMPALAIVGLCMWALTLFNTARAALSVPLRDGAPWWCRPLIFAMHLLQPPLRAWHRYMERMKRKLPQRSDQMDLARARSFKRSARATVDGYWTSNNGKGREDLLAVLEGVMAEQKIAGVFDHAWGAWDMSLFVDRWHNWAIRTVTEELGGARRFTRVRCVATFTALAKLAIAGSFIWTSAALLSGQRWAQALGICLLVPLAVVIHSSRRNGRVRITAMIDRAAAAAGLRRFSQQQPAAVKPAKPPAPAARQRIAGKQQIVFEDAIEADVT